MLVRAVDTQNFTVCFTDHSRYLLKVLIDLLEAAHMRAVLLVRPQTFNWLACHIACSSNPRQQPSLTFPSCKAAYAQHHWSTCAQANTLDDDHHARTTWGLSWLL